MLQAAANVQLEDESEAGMTDSLEAVDGPEEDNDSSVATQACSKGGAYSECGVCLDRCGTVAFLTVLLIAI